MRREGQRRPRGRRQARRRQISRFLILHKELDADDGELTRTRKVRRGFIAEKYQVLVDALYGGKTEQFIETAVKFEDGRTRQGRGRRCKIVDAKTFRAMTRKAPHETGGRAESRAGVRVAARKRGAARGDAGALQQRIGDVILDVQNISLRFGGVKALTDISFDVREHEIRAIIGPNGAGKSSMLNCINGVYQPQQGSITFRGKTFSAHELAPGRRDGRRAHLPEPGAVQGHERARQHHDRAAT